MKAFEKNKYLLGIVLGAFMSLIIIVSNVFLENTNFGGNNYFTAVVVSYLSLAGFYTLSGYLQSGKHKKLKIGAEAGAITAFISIGLSVLTVFILNNYFLTTLSRYGLTSSTVVSVNMQLLKITIIGLPIATLLGAIFGGLGAQIRKVS